MLKFIHNTDIYYFEKFYNCFNKLFLAYLINLCEAVANSVYRMQFHLIECKNRTVECFFVLKHKFIKIYVCTYVATYVHKRISMHNCNGMKTFVHTKLGERVQIH